MQNSGVYVCTKSKDGLKRVNNSKFQYKFIYWLRSIAIRIQYVLLHWTIIQLYWFVYDVQIEETILESTAWRSDSSLWETFKQPDNTVPSVEEVDSVQNNFIYGTQWKWLINNCNLRADMCVAEIVQLLKSCFLIQVSLPCQIEKDGQPQRGAMTSILSPLQHPALRRVVTEGNQAGNKLPPNPAQSPTGPTVSDRFNSPSPGSAKRRLFGPTGQMQGSATTINTVSATIRSPGGSPAAGSSGQPVVLAQTDDGRQVREYD